MPTTQRDTVELREIRSALRERRRWIWSAAALGALAALALSLLSNPRYQGATTVLLRAEGSQPFSLGAGMVPFGGYLDMLSSDAFDTELEILTSRSVVGAVVDSLALQVVVLDPEDTPARALVESVRTGPRPPRKAFRFERDGDRFRVSGPGVRGFAVPGQPFEVAGGQITLRTGDLPASFRLRLLGREAAIEAVLDDLGARSAGGEVAELRYAARDPLTAAEVPNTMVARYLERRRTTDRGVNQHRYEFLQAQSDSIGTALALAEQRLRAYQEASGVLDPAVMGQAGLEEAVRLQGSLADLDVEAGALERILAAPRLSTRELAAYPTLLRNPAINSILNQMLELEVELAELLERRTEREPNVVLVRQQIAQLEGELARLTRAYLRGLQEQRVQLQRELGKHGAVLASMPAHAQQVYAQQREVKRLSETLALLQAQLVHVRLAAMGEGGDVRPIDPAVPPVEPYFPKPALFTVGGGIAGVFFGIAAALMMTFLGRRVRSTWEAERITGAPAVLLRPGDPLLLAGLNRATSVLIASVGNARPAVAGAALAATATLHGRRAALVDLGGHGVASNRGARSQPVPELSSSGGSDEPGTAIVPSNGRAVDGYVEYQVSHVDVAPLRIRQAMDELRERFDLVVVAAPPLECAVTTSLIEEERPVVLVATRGEATRDELADAADRLHRLRVPIAGVVLTTHEERSVRAR